MNFSLKLTNPEVDGYVVELDGEGPVRGKCSGCFLHHFLILLAARAWLFGEYPGGSHSTDIGELVRLMTRVLRLLRRVWDLVGVDVGVDEGIPVKERRLLTNPLLLDDDDGMAGRMGEGFCWDGDQQGDMGE